MLPECVTLLNVVLWGGMAGHEGEQAGGRITGGVGDPLQGVAHDDHVWGGGGDCHPV